MSVDTASRCLKAAADPTRLRLLTILSAGEATVGELQAILGQSQPRVSRHLKLLAEAGLVERFRDGHWVYYRLRREAAQQALVRAALELIGRDDAAAGADRDALQRIKRERERQALSERPLLLAAGGSEVDPASVEAGLAELLGEGGLGTVLLAGCGGTALLPWLARRARSLVGIDADPQARLLARSRAHELGLGHCTIRAARLGDPGLPAADFDLVVLNRQFARGAPLAEALDGALPLLRPRGRLLILDRVLPVRRRLDEQPSRLDDGQLTAALAERGARVLARYWLPGRAPDHALIFAAPAAVPGRTGTDG